MKIEGKTHSFLLSLGIKAFQDELGIFVRFCLHHLFELERQNLSYNTQTQLAKGWSSRNKTSPE